MEKGDGPKTTVIMPGDPYKASLKQTSAGKWYVDKIQVSAKTLDDFRERLEKATHEVKEKVNRLNMGIDESPKPKKEWG